MWKLTSCLCSRMAAVVGSSFIVHDVYITSLIAVIIFYKWDVDA